MSTNLAVALFRLAAVFSAAQNCGAAALPAWSPQLTNVIQGCESVIASPNKQLIFKLRADGTLALSSAAGAPLSLSVAPVEPPAMVSWAPTSDAFFINDGEGSGMSSVLRVFRISGTRVEEDANPERVAVGVYRKLRRCAADRTDPNVWGIGWSSDGTRLHLLVQSAVNEPCGPPGSFIGLTISPRTGRVVEQLSENATKRRFRSLLPAEIRAK
jgi:hypothetical protein